jgi:hypothetical protein
MLGEIFALGTEQMSLFCAMFFGKIIYKIFSDNKEGNVFIK